MLIKNISVLATFTVATVVSTLHLVRLQQINLLVHMFTLKVQKKNQHNRMYSICFAGCNVQSAPCNVLRSKIVQIQSQGCAAVGSRCSRFCLTGILNSIFELCQFGAFFWSVLLDLLIDQYYYSILRKRLASNFNACR